MPTRKELATAVGVSRQTLSDWAKQGCPVDGSTAEIQTWRESNKRPLPETTQARLLRAQADKAEQEARLSKLKADKLAGELYEADEVERNVAELTSMIRNHLEAIPEEIQMEWPKEIRLQVTQRMKDEIHRILKAMSQWRLPSWADDEAETQAAV